jgi:CheY-like chemotaxis protein
VQDVPRITHPHILRSELQGLRALIVDDNATNRRILQEMLARWGMASEAAEGGSEALEAMMRACDERKAFSLVLLDAHMPEMDGFAIAKHIRGRPEFQEAAIVILTSCSWGVETKRCREIGISAHLTKPVRQSELEEAITRALGKTPTGEAPAQPVAADQDVPASDTSRRSSRKARGGLQILLAEDNPVSQKLAKRLLEKRGHRVTLASSGREVLQAVERERFDLILMDIQMPEVDGFEATARIRQRERGTGRQVPIIAVTAHATEHDRERCLEADMDGYISKPFLAKELDEAIEKALKAPTDHKSGTPAGLRRP